MENVRGQNQERMKHPEKNQSTERSKSDPLRQDQSSNRTGESQRDQQVANPTTRHTQRQEGMEGRNEGDAII